MNNPVTHQNQLELEWRTANMADIYAILVTLSEKFPKTFFIDEKKVKPLKIGIYEDIKVALGLKNKYDRQSKRQKRLILAALELYTLAPSYLQKASWGLYRINLEGNRTERVTESSARYSKAKLLEIKQKNTLVKKDTSNPVIS